MEWYLENIKPLLRNCLGIEPKQIIPTSDGKDAGKSMYLNLKTNETSTKTI